MKEGSTGEILIIGYGNPGRLDDGLGPSFAKAIEDLGLPGVRVERDYQLTVEDAADVARFRTVIFADADTKGPEPFWIRRIGPSGDGMSFSSHSVSPEGVLTLARDLFHSEPDAFLLGIRGYEFNEFEERLSEKARSNLAEAVKYMESAFRGNEIVEYNPGGRDAAPESEETEERG